LLLVGDNVVEVLAAAQQVAIATALGDFEDVLTFQAITAGIGQPPPDAGDHGSRPDKPLAEGKGRRARERPSPTDLALQ
jgi:hypothetical protein